MASRNYQRYDRSRSRDRSPDRYNERTSQYGDGDRRRSSAELRHNNAAFQSNREPFGDPLRRDPPRGPKALIDAPSGPRGGGFVGDFRGGRGRGRGRGWTARDESRDRGRDRDVDYRDRYRDDRSREHERDRDRDRDWRDARDFRSRRSPLGRPRSPARDFRDRDRDGPLGVDADRSRRGSRDGGPPSAGSTSSDPFGLPPYLPRGGSFHRGRGRGRGEWPAERGRGRAPFMDDRNDRYPRSRSQEGRWGRDRDERDRMDKPDRYADGELRHQRDDRDPRERELFRSKLEARTSISHETMSNKEITPPPLAPSAPAFGSVSNRPSFGADVPPANATAAAGKPPPTAPRAFGDRPPSSGGHDGPVLPSGLAKPVNQESPPIPVGPRAQQQKQQRSSKQWINPNLRKTPDSPKMMRAPSFGQQRPPPLHRDSFQHDQSHGEETSPRSSDAKSDTHMSDYNNRARSQYSAEPGEITVKSERDSYSARESMDRDVRGPSSSRGTYRAGSGPSPTTEKTLNFPSASSEHAEERRVLARDLGKPKRKTVKFALNRVEVPPKKLLPTANSESDDDDEDMADYFAMEIEKTEAELGKLEKPRLPTEVMARFAGFSHGSMVKIMKEGEGLVDMVGPLPEGFEIPEDAVEALLPAVQKPSEDMEMLDAPASTETVHGNTDKVADEEVPKEKEAEAKAEVPQPVDPNESKKAAATPEPEPKTEEMDTDVATAEILPSIPDAPKEPVIEPEVTAVSEASKGSDFVDQTAIPSSEPEKPAEIAPTPVPDFADVSSALPLETTEPNSKPASTPSQVADDDETESEESFYVNIDDIRQFMATPPIDSLPDYNCTPWDQDEKFLETLDGEPNILDYVSDHIKHIDLERTTEQKEAQHTYASNYAHYLDFTLSNDPAAVKSRGKFSASTGVVEGTGSVTPEQKHEGSGRGRRFATERDLERVLQASMREDEERKERELRMQKEKYRSEKEAIIPEMFWSQEEKDDIDWVDRSGYCPPDRLVSSWRVLPPVDNFTTDETELFEKKYMEAPKQWGKIAESVPHRDFGTCIQYYYMKKKELNLKEKLKKQPKRRKKGGRGKQRSSALVSELGNGDGETEDNHDHGENGERRRPRRAAAPTWGYEDKQGDTESSTPTGTPGRRGGSAAARGDQPEKVDGRKGRRKAKDKEPKAPKANQTLAAAPTPGAGRGRSRSNSRAHNIEFQPPVAAEVHRLPTQFEPSTSAMQPPFQMQQPPPIQTLERPPPMPTSSISEVMAPPPLRPEPPPAPAQPAMSTFNLAQPQPERKAPTQASSYWSVSETNDFPHLLASFGSDWTGIAAHMGSKTAVMVKNYFVRQKDQGKMEWEAIVKEADGKRMRGEPLPEAPQPSIGGRGRRYDNSTSTSRPLAVATSIDLRTEASQAKIEGAGPGHRGQPFSSYGVPIAQAPVQQPLSHSPQQGLAMQQHQPSHPTPQQAMSPAARPLRAPFSFPEREREPGQRMPLPQKAPTLAEPPREQPPLASKVPLMTARGDPLMAQKPPPQDTQKIEMQLREQQQQQHLQREKERELSRQAERQSLRVKQEPDAPPPQHHYEPFGHRSHSSLGQPLARAPPLDPGRQHAYAPSIQAQPPSQPVRSIMNDQPPIRSPQMAAPTSRPVSSLQSRPSSGSLSETYRSVTPQTATPSVAPPAPPRPPEPRKTSSIMSLLNDDTDTPPPKRVSDVVSTPMRPSPTPPPPSMGRSLASAPPPSQMRREPESQYSPYGRAPSGGASAMPPLKPSFSDASQAQHMGSSRASMGVSVDPAASERDYYRQHSYQSSQQPSAANSPQGSHRYPPPGQPSQVQYQSSTGYPTPYGSSSQQPHASSPTAQYSLHPSASRAREVPQGGGREPSWPSSSHQPPPSNMQQPSGWPTQPPPNTSQPPPGQQPSWQPGHPAAKPATPAPSWASAPPPPQQAHHMSMRDDPRGSGYYSSPGSSLAQQQQQQQPPQHQMPGRYAPPTSRGPEPVPPPAAAYPRYASTPGPVNPRDPRDMPGRSYTPVGYDSRGPPQPPPPTSGYPGPDPREMQLRDSRDPRDPRDPREQHEMMARGLRPPHDYDQRRHDQYRR